MIKAKLTTFMNLVYKSKNKTRVALYPLVCFTLHLSTVNTFVKWCKLWHISYIELWILKSSKLWSSQLWTQFKQSRREALQRVWTHDLVIPVRRFNQLRYEATDVGRWSFLGSNEPTPLLHMEAGCPENASYMKTPCTLSKVKLQAPAAVRASALQDYR